MTVQEMTSRQQPSEHGLPPAEGDSQAMEFARALPAGTAARDSDPLHKVALAWASAVSLILTPVLAAAVTAYFSFKSHEEAIAAESISQEKTIAAEYIKIGLNILSKQPEQTSSSTRAWAAELINYYAPVKLSEDVKGEVVSSAVIPVNASFHNSYLNENEAFYTFTWGAGSGPWEFEVQQYEKGRWHLVTGATLTTNNYTVAVPVNTQLRWQARSTSQGASEPAQWHELRLVKAP